MSIVIWLGGIYTMQRLIRDSLSDQPAVTYISDAYVHYHDPALVVVGRAQEL